MKVAFKYMAPVLACGQVMAAPSNLSASAKVSVHEARGIALKAYPGKFVKEELEPEKGRQRSALLLRHGPGKKGR